MTAIILAAGLGGRLSSFIDNRPKCLIKVGSVSLLERSLWYLNNAGVTNVIIVIGYYGNMIKNKIGFTFKRVNIGYVTNEDYAFSSTMRSLYQTKELVNGDVIILEGDLLYSPEALSCIIESEIKDIMLTSIPSPSDEGAYLCVDKNNNLVDIIRGRRNKAHALGELVGITKLSKESMHELYKIAENDFNKGIMNRYYEDAILILSKNRPVKCFFKDVVWVGINHKQDLSRAFESSLVSFPYKVQKKLTSAPPNNILQ